jgi:2'-5' RNA ligase
MDAGPEDKRKFMTTYTELSLWLTPREPLRSLLRSTILRLAAQYDAVEFEPHVTVFCGPSTDDEARAVVRRVAGQFGPLELIGDRLDHTHLYTKTLFVQFRDSAALRSMFETVATHCSRPSSYVLNPHLSLLYKKLSSVTLKTLSQTLSVPMGDYAFDRLRMIKTEVPIEDEGPVKRWRVVCDEPLLGSRY